MKKKSKIWKPKNQLFRDKKAITSLRLNLFQQSNVSVRSNWVHPPGNPRGLAQKTCPVDRDLTFESCPGAANSTRTGILWKMKVKLQKNSVDQIFTGENKNKLNF